jgi:hypothetical protein
MGWLGSVLLRAFRRGRKLPKTPAVAETFARSPELRITLARGAVSAANEAIAGFAWLNYAEGSERGVVWVSQTIGCYGEDLLAALRQMLYIPQDQLRKLGCTHDDPLSDAVRRYDPGTEVLVLVRHENQTEFFFPLKPHLPPPQAGERMRAFVLGASRERLADDAPFGHVAASYHACRGDPGRIGHRP